MKSVFTSCPYRRGQGHLNDCPPQAPLTTRHPQQLPWADALQLEEVMPFSLSQLLTAVLAREGGNAEPHPPQIAERPRSIYSPSLFSHQANFQFFSPKPYSKAYNLLHIRSSSLQDPREQNYCWCTSFPIPKTCLTRGKRRTE